MDNCCANCKHFEKGGGFGVCRETTLALGTRPNGYCSKHEPKVSRKPQWRSGGSLGEAADQENCAVTKRCTLTIVDDDSDDGMLRQYGPLFQADVTRQMNGMVLGVKVAGMVSADTAGQTSVKSPSLRDLLERVTPNDSPFDEMLEDEPEENDLIGALSACLAATIHYLNSPHMPEDHRNISASVLHLSQAIAALENGRRS